MKANIEVFGGDPDRVIRRFHGHQRLDGFAAAERSFPARNWRERRPIRTPHPRQRCGTGRREFAATLDANSLESLRAKSAKAILNANGATGIIVDGCVLPDDVYILFKNCQQNDVPLLTGLNANHTSVPATLKADALLAQSQLGRWSGYF